MLSVILIWLYMLFTIGVIGIALIALGEHVIGYKRRGFLPILLAGTVGATWYAEVYSLFGKVSLGANIVLCIICVTLFIFLRKKVTEIIKEAAFVLKTNRLLGIIFVFLFLLMAYGTSHGLIHYDTGLYHAQAIHWIEEYGIVTGLGNLHTRLAYNSAAFPFTALYSFAFLSGQSFHVTAGFCALILAWECVGIRRVFLEKTMEPSFFARLMAVYYLLMIFDEMISPASDYYMVCLAFVLIIRALEACELCKKEALPNTLSMLALFAGYILTIKLSGALLILIAVYPVAEYIRQKKYTKIIFCTVGEVIIILPYIIRNFILSGYLLYPSTAFDFFDVDWKIPHDIALSDYKEIQVYGRGYTDVGSYDMPISKWFGTWLNNQSTIDKLLIVAAIVGVIYFVIKCIYYGFSIVKGGKSKVNPAYLVVEGTVCICFVFWLLSSPLIRYGCLFVYLTAAIVWGNVFISIAKNKYIQVIFYVSLSLICIYKLLMLGKEVVRYNRNDTWIVQQDYDNFEVSSYMIDDKLFYMPIEGDRVGYLAFPSSPWQMELDLRGEDIGDGFRAIIN